MLITGGRLWKRFLNKSSKTQTKKVIIFQEMNEAVGDENKFNNYENLRFFVGDIRDKERLARAIDQVDIVIHAAQDCSNSRI